MEIIYVLNIKERMNTALHRVTFFTVVDHHIHMKLLHLSVTTVMKQYKSD